MFRDLDPFSSIATLEHFALLDILVTQSDAHFHLLLQNI